MNKKLFLYKKLFFLFLRMQSSISIYEGRQTLSGLPVKLCYVGCPKRGSYYLIKLFGYQPEGRTIGKCYPALLSGSHHERLPEADVVMIEINRLLMNRYIKKSYFPIPEWVEFGRYVVKDSALRYVGASKSLRSDLNRIFRSDFQVALTKNPEEFDLFYEEMYLPYLFKRYGSECIVKSKPRLRKVFNSGFILFLKLSDVAIAGAVILVEDNKITEAAIGVRDGSDEILKAGVSGILDFHVHQWAAENNKTFLNVGHTRPLPLDGVYFNKRKWMMSVKPDEDGVMNIATKFNLPDTKAAIILDSFPFVFQIGRKLNLLSATSSEHPLNKDAIKSLYHRYWTDGIDKLFIFSPAGFDGASTFNAPEKNEKSLVPVENISKILKKCL